MAVRYVRAYMAVRYAVFGLGVFSMARRHALVSLRHAAPASAMLPFFFTFFFILFFYFF